MSIFNKLFGKKEDKISPNLPSENQSGSVYKAPTTGKNEQASNNHVYKKKGNYDASIHEVDIDSYSWDDVIGMNHIKEDLQDVVALLHPDIDTKEAIEHWGLDCPKGMLMYGPPGCGKTHIAKALASECKAKFYLINGPEIMDMHVGEAAKKLRAIYETAQQQKPSIIFIDEIDSIATRRDVSQSQSAQEVITTLLSLMDGLKEIDGIFTIGATNCPEMIDTALLRPGRMGKGIYVNVPDPETREALLNKYLNNKPLEEDVCVEELVDKSHNCSIADIVAIVDTAARIAWRRNGRKATGKINQMDFLKAHESTGSSVSTEKLIAYEQWRNYAFA